MRLYVALENIRSLQNVGSIIRSCSFFGVTDVLLVGYSGIFDMGAYKTLHPKISKASLGAEKDICFHMLETSEELLTFAHSHNLELIAIEQHETSLSLRKFTPKSDCIIVFGNERDGVSSFILNSCATIVEIERLGIKSSLNVATAAGIVLYALKSLFL